MIEEQTYMKRELTRIANEFESMDLQAVNKLAESTNQSKEIKQSMAGYSARIKDIVKIPRNVAESL